MGKKSLLEKYQVERVKCDNWTRVMGYYRPARLIERANGKQEETSSFNIGKQGEFKERVFFNTECSCACHA